MPKKEVKKVAKKATSRAVSKTTSVARIGGRRGSRRTRRAKPRVGLDFRFLFLMLILVAGVYFFINPPGISPIIDGEIAVHFIDVGQGEATLITTRGGNILIDGGDTPMGTRVSNYLRSVGVNSLTYVVATHPHADHIGGLIEVLQVFDVGAVIMPQVAHTTRTFENFIEVLEDRNLPVRAPVAGHSFNLGGASFTIVAPNFSGYSNLNDYSIVLRMDYGDVSFLFTGDAERLSEEEILAAGHDVSVDVLRVGHHGSHTSTSENFLAAIDPTIAVISAGANNQFGHPHGAVIDRLTNADIHIFRTDYHGTIVMSTDGREIIVH